MRAHSGFVTHLSGLFCASPTRLRSALRHCTATTICASPSLIPFLWKDPWRNPRLVPILVYFNVSSWFCFRALSRFMAISVPCYVDQDSIHWPLRSRRSQPSRRSPLGSGYDPVSAGLVGFLSLLSCVSLVWSCCAPEASTGCASSGHSSCAVDEARASLWPMPGAVLWESISCFVAAPSLGYLDQFPVSVWGFVGVGCVPVCLCVIRSFAWSRTRSFSWTCGFGDFNRSFFSVFRPGLLQLPSHFRCSVSLPRGATTFCVLFLVLWQAGFAGIRVGEASNPGPIVGIRWSDYTLSEYLRIEISWTSWRVLFAHHSPLLLLLLLLLLRKPRSSILLYPVLLLPVLPLLVLLASALTPGLVLLPVARLALPALLVPAVVLPFLLLLPVISPLVPRLVFPLVSLLPGPVVP